VHQIRFRLWLCPRPGLQRSPDPLAGFKGPTYKGRGGEGRGRRGEGWERRGGEGREEKRKGGEESGRSTCLPPRFDNPGYGPGRVPGFAISYLTVEK